jgi:hypothetical protein
LFVVLLMARVGASGKPGAVHSELEVVRFH